jgi:enoyl-CoA hydratase/carnithine racemase
MQPSDSTIRLERDAFGVATLTLHRPEVLNAWNGRMAAEVDRVLRECEADDGVRAVVITGAGRAFCAGADLARGADSFGARRSRGGPKRGLRTRSGPAR